LHPSSPGAACLYARPQILLFFSGARPLPNEIPRWPSIFLVQTTRNSTVQP
jgi:hypothetical protein